MGSGKTIQNAAWLASLTLLWVMTTSCRHFTPAASDASETKQIFSDQQRAAVAPPDYPYILSLHGRCTAFILDTAFNGDQQQLVGMTAKHCQPSLGQKLCWGAGNLYDPQCIYSAKIESMIEASDFEDLDYVIFKFRFDTLKPAAVRAVRLARHNQLSAALNQGERIAMLGYPVDKYQRADLTRSDCRVRSDVRSPSGSVDSFSSRLIAAWQSNARYTNHPAYQDMREACYFVSDAPNSRGRPSFLTDCSVYGGNSGGPMLIAAAKVVIGMPATYYPEGGYTPSCYKKKYGDDNYWDIFFRPVVGTGMPTTQQANWDKLNRNSQSLSGFPGAIPMHTIVQQSKFLQAHPDYLADDIFQPEPPKPNNDLLVALGSELLDKPGSFALKVSVRKTGAVEDTAKDTEKTTVESLDYCVGIDDLCTDPTQRVSLKSPVGVGDRLVFTAESKDALDLTNKQPKIVHFVGRNNLGQILVKRTLSFLPPQP